MKKVAFPIMLFAAIAALPVGKASAQDPLAGALIGGALGGVVGGVVSGGKAGGVAVGAILGATAGAASSSLTPAVKTTPASSRKRCARPISRSTVPSGEPW